MTRKEVIKAQDEWRDKQIAKGVRCERCNSENTMANRLSVDHIIPDHWLTQLGFDVDRHFDLDNLSILCRRCNTFKAGRVDPADKRVYPLLKKYIENIKPL